MFSGADLYKDLALSDIQINDKLLSGNIFNSGIQEATVPQLLINLLQYK